eukprot:CAMPEP_0198143596 /NCGR_PEP_ID=MMETSP1443-20131203/8562_1 /TAXON_ID=186043 /ORGANISM="Entomoneis sp., Strain CCMP2396" /LENGTH=226 /DNA_ID=CAMNT_0043806859 /DNA_START=231 /DNA_END=911 /DNA_ORIENTATION=-
MTPAATLEVLRVSLSTDEEEQLDDDVEECQLELDLLELASREIEQVRNQPPPLGGIRTFQKFPRACLAILKNMEGNQRCVDCGDRDPQWAAVSYGALLCLNCSGHHRSLGVQVSCVRSVLMDEWSLEHVLNMLEGGNAQLTDFFSRHHLSEEALMKRKGADEATQAKVINKSNVTRLRYKTKAALFYRQQMALHTARVVKAGPYRGREMSRRLKQPRLDHRHSNLE